MGTKLHYYSAVADRAAKEATAKRGSWANFLDTAARLYKYPFPDQLMIHAQRPGATACAPIETWNDSFNRWVRRGSKGIALIDDTGSYPRLKYIFDVSDTEASLQNSRPVYLWEMRQEHKVSVLDALAKTYDDVGESLADTFRNIAKQLAHEYYEDNAREIRYRAENSFLEEYDDFNLGVAFENALTVSIAYTLMSRCGFDTDEYFEDDDFQCIFDFNTPDMVYALGTAASDLSEQVLRDIELVIKKYERGALQMSEALTYTMVGDYLLPDLTLDEPPRELTEPLGRYGRMRKAFLKEHRTMTFNAMLLKETLFPHLRETEEAANARLTQVMNVLTERNSLPDKATDPMGWTAAMNALKAQAEEMVLSELIYTY